MVTKLIFKNGEEWYLKYISLKDDYDIIPFQNEIYDKPVYLPNGIFELLDGRKILVQDKKIMKFI